MGTSTHQFKKQEFHDPQNACTMIWSAIQEARKGMDLHVVWLDLANEYGSVSHKLIQKAMDFSEYQRKSKTWYWDTRNREFHMRFSTKKYVTSTSWQLVGIPRTGLLNWNVTPHSGPLLCWKFGFACLGNSRRGAFNLDFWHGFSGSCRYTTITMIRMEVMERLVSRHIHRWLDVPRSGSLYASSTKLTLATTSLIEYFKVVKVFLKFRDWNSPVFRIARPDVSSGKKW